MEKFTQNFALHSWVSGILYYFFRTEWLRSESNSRSIRRIRSA